MARRPIVATMKMNLPLSPEMHRQIFEEAKDQGVPATRLVREVLHRWLSERARQKEADELREFAKRHAGTSIDLDPELEAEAAKGLAHLGSDEAR